MLFSEFESELKKITGKCAKIMYEYRKEKFGKQELQKLINIKLF